jgi:hypothetical protein
VLGRRTAARGAGARLRLDPEILFFDEPLSAIDYRLRKTLEVELKELHQRTGKTFVYITHSLEEAMVMSDRIAIMRSGHIIQMGTPAEIYRSPASRFVASFMGEVNILEVEHGRFADLDQPAPGHGPPLRGGAARGAAPRCGRDPGGADRDPAPHARLAHATAPARALGRDADFGGGGRRGGLRAGTTHAFAFSPPTSPGSTNDAQPGALVRAAGGRCSCWPASPCPSSS